MNAHQRRKRRRALGCRPPYSCLWCGTSLPAWDAPCSCVAAEDRSIQPGIRRLPGDMTLSALAGAAWDRGLELSFNIVSPRDAVEEVTP